MTRRPFLSSESAYGRRIIGDDKKVGLRLMVLVSGMLVWTSGGKVPGRWLDVARRDRVRV